VIIAAMIAQFSVGLYLKLHIHEKSIRPYFVVVHGIIGKSWPILGWLQVRSSVMLTIYSQSRLVAAFSTQMLFGAITIRGYCGGDHTTQCIAHYTMGSAFIGYGILLALGIYVGAEWLKRRGQSQEFFDSWVILLWGIVNTFTEHEGSLLIWSHEDLQHT
jgi:hypothetical protein